MQNLTRPAWLAKVDQVTTELVVDPDDIETWRYALVRVWTLLPLAPVTVQGAYGNLPEADIAAAADAAYASDGVAPGPLVLTDVATDDARLTRLAGWLRAAERKIADMDEGQRAGDPNEDWLHEIEGEGFYLIPLPRSAWRPPYGPGDPPRPFTRRAILRFRILPAVIGGLAVRFTDGRRPGRERPGLSYGASLFAGFDVLSQDEHDEKHFLALEAVGPTRESVRDDIVAAARHGCSAHVFPELTLMPEMRDVVARTLARAEWTDSGEGATGPDLVVAGSWHERHSDGVWNEAVVFDSVGNELLRFRKLFRFRDEKGRYEKIGLGQTLEVLVTRRGLYGFGVCLDFCQRATPVLTDLDVDWMMVPSCGDWRTMRDHLSAANELQVRFDTRSFVVQQVYPKRKDGGLGYVLPAPSRVGELRERELRISQTFSYHQIVP